MIKFNYLFLIFACLLLTQCMPVVGEKPISEVIINLNEDKTLHRLLDYQDRQEIDSLILFFSDKNPSYRYIAAQAFSSIKSPDAIDELKNLLTDDVSKVRTAAAFALGQIGDEKAESHLIAAFDGDDSLSLNQDFNAAVLEAVGKCGTKNSLESIASVSTYRRADTTLVKGQALSVYRFGLREIISEKGTKSMVDLLVKSGYPEEVQLIAANYFGRAKKVKLDTTQIVALSKKFVATKSPEIKMALALGLGQTKSIQALDYLITGLRGEPDYRVKSNIIRALSNFEYIRVKPIMLGMLNDDNKHVSNAAANYFLEYGIRNDVNLYRKKALEQSHWWPRATLYRTANKHLSIYSVNTRLLINNEIKKRIAETNNVAEKAELFKALAEDPNNYKTIENLGLNADQPLLRISALQSLVDILGNENLPLFLRSRTFRIQAEIGELLKTAIENADPGMVAVAADALRNPSFNYTKQFEEYEWMENAFDKLKLPRDIEAFNELEKTLAFFKATKSKADSKNEEEEPAEKKEVKLTKATFNNPIDWRRVKNITERTEAKVQTNRGVFNMRFYKNEAPGSAANFIKLAKDGFFDGKPFHRVVSNFVIQGGCPRGDGYGSLDYTIRSELSQLSYDKEGYVGMASAGNHTECTQWFVTHSPTLHLDGNYTIFAHITSGMDIVHKIEPGDVIEKILIIN